MIDKQIKFTMEDVRSPTWKKVKEYAEGQLRTLRSELERDKTPEQTSKLRGQIRSLVLLLSLDDIRKNKNQATAFGAESDDDSDE